MSSPIFNSSRDFAPPAPGAAPAPGTPAGLEAQFDAPAATPAQMGRMTYEGVTTKTAGLVILAGLLAIPGYMFFNFAALIITAITGLVLGLVLAFKRTTPPALVIAYAAIEGYFLGSITTLIETRFDAPGAGLQALIATGVTFGVCLWLYRSGRVRYTSKMRRFFIIGGLSYLAFSLVNIGVMVFSGTENGFGLRSDVEIMGIPLGVLVGAFAIILACIALIGDFDFIQNGVEKGLAAQFEWRAAFGLVVSLVWLYIEFLRIIAILSGRD